jgi:hypothetical protein
MIVSFKCHPTYVVACLLVGCRRSLRCWDRVVRVYLREAAAHSYRSEGECRVLDDFSAAIG